MSAYDPRFGFDPVAAFLRRPLHEIVGAHPNETEKESPPAERSVAGLASLANEFAWAAVLELSSSLLSEDDDKTDANTSSSRPFLLPHERLFCAAYRALALLQTRQLDRAADAIAELGSLKPTNERYVYETYRDLYPASEFSRGSFVPFELLILAIEIRARQSDATAIADCYELKVDCTRQAQDANPELANKWRTREGFLLSCLASYFLKMQQHDAAVDVARELVGHQARSAAALYLYARVLLHVGDFENAEIALREADRMPDSTLALKHVHNGILLAAKGRFQDAILEYDTALAEEKSEEPRKSPYNLWVFASNNVAICLMHSGRLAEAIDRLEGTLRRDPETALDEGLVFNLSTLYDLAYPDSSTEKKRVIQRLASRFGRQGFDLDRVSLS